MTARLPSRAAVGALAGVLLLLGPWACGYRLAGGPGGPPALALSLAPVQDEGDEPLFGALLAGALTREVLDRGYLSLAAEGTGDAVLSVRVDSVEERGAAYAVPQVTREYVLRARVTATLTRPDGTVWWRDRSIEADRDFPAGTTVNELERNKDRALDLIAGDLAREVLRRIAVVPRAAQ